MSQLFYLSFIRIHLKAWVQALPQISKSPKSAQIDIERKDAMFKENILKDTFKVWVWVSSLYYKSQIKNGEADER